MYKRIPTTSALSADPIGFEFMEDRRLLSAGVPTNVAPVFDPVRALTVEQGKELGLRVTASDLDMLSATVRLTNGPYTCSAVLISPIHVLTAAHCVRDGETTVTFSDTAITRTVTSSVRHFRDDIAVLQLDAPVDIAPLALYRQSSEVGLQTFLSGYAAGAVHFGMNAVDNADSYLYFDVDPGEFSAGPGDSGGPALINGQVAGVASFTFADEFFYTRVSRYLSFIDSVVPANPASSPQALKFALVNGPAGAVFDPETATFSWTPGAQAAPGTHFATIRVTDNGSTPLSDELTLAIEVLPGQPAVDVGPDVELDEGGTFTSHGSYAFLAGPAVSASVDYGDGSGAQSLPFDPAGQTFQLSHLYFQSGSFRPTVTIIDSLGNAVTGSTGVAVDNVAPRADAGGPYVFIQGNPVVLDASRSFDPGKDIVLYEWGFELLDYFDEENPDDGEVIGTGALFTPVRYVNPGDFEMELRVTDADGARSVVPFLFHILANHPPSFDPIANRTVNEDSGRQNVPITGVLPGPPAAVYEAGQTVTLIATSSDPALIPNPTVTGSGPTRTLSYTPAANRFGTATITVIATDGQSAGNIFKRAFTVTVNPVNDADLSIHLTESSSPAGRLRTLTYTITVVNKGPDAADQVSIAAAIPAGTSFNSTSLFPATRDTAKVAWSLKSILAGAKTSFTMTVNVLSSAPSTLLSSAQVSTTSQEPSLADNFVTRATPVTNVGAFEVKTPSTVTAGQHVPIELGWTVPGGKWRELKTVDLRVLDDAGTVLWVRFDEAANTLSLFNPHTRRFGQGFAPGSSNVLSNGSATLHLRGSSVKASGPTSPTVVLTLDVSFSQQVVGSTFRLEAAATDDLGNIQDFELAASLGVLR
jgi:uncharacterized repeat protein (TIGR01451 family)